MPTRDRDGSRGRHLVVAALAALVLTAPACGGDDDSQSDADKVKAVVTDFYAALGDGDGAKACDLVTGSAEARLSPGSRSCEDAVAQEAERYDDDFRGKLRKIQVRDIEVEGDEATCTAKANRTARVELKKQGDDWKITDY
jgi:hypothetical protein